MNIQTRVIEGIISERQERTDQNGNTYLLLKLDTGEAIFVFSSNVREELWIELEEGSKFEFTVEEGRNGSNLLAKKENPFKLIS